MKATTTKTVLAGVGVIVSAAYSNGMEADKVAEIDEDEDEEEVEMNQFR